MILVRFIVIVLIFIFFFGSSLVEYGLFPEQINAFAPELLIYSLLLIAVTLKARFRVPFRLPGIAFAILLTAFSLMSGVALGISWPNTVLMLRILLRFYFMFLALVNLPLSGREIHWYLRLLVVLFIVQIPTAAYKMTIFGQGESAIGTYGVHGGGLSTAIPMIATGFLLTYYFSYRRSYWYLIGTLGFVAFGLIGAKKAIFVVIPLIGLFAIWNARHHSVRGRSIRVRSFLLTVVAMLIIAYTAVRTIPDLNPERRVGGAFDLGYLLDFSVEYNTTESRGIATSRGATWKKSLEHANKSWTSMLVGLGPGRVMKSRFSGVGRGESIGSQGTKYGGGIQGLGILYGLNGFCWLLLQVGYPGTLAWFGFFFFSLFVLKRFVLSEPEPFWKSFYLGMVCFSFTFLWISFTYGSFMIMGDLPTFLYFLLLAFAFLRKSGGWVPRKHRLTVDLP